VLHKRDGEVSIVSLSHSLEVKLQPGEKACLARKWPVDYRTLVQFDIWWMGMAVKHRGLHYIRRTPRNSPVALTQSRRYMLQQDQVDRSLRPRIAEKISLDPDQRSEQATHAILHECVEQIAANIMVVRSLADPEGPHQLRIGLRRLRSAFAALSSASRSPEMTRLGEEARWLGRQVGRLRDLDVVASEIVPREAKADPRQPGFPKLADSIRREVSKRREDLRTLLAGVRGQAFLDDLTQFVERPGWHGEKSFYHSRELAIPVSKLARKALTKSWDKARKRGRGIKSLGAEQRHELRKALKKLRYTVEFFSSLYRTKDVKRFSARLKKLQKLCGDVNDAAMVKAMLSDNGAFSDADPQRQRAMGWVIGANQVRAEFGWNGAKGQWRKLKKSQPFWE